MLLANLARVLYKKRGKDLNSKFILKDIHYLMLTFKLLSPAFGDKAYHTGSSLDYNYQVAAAFNFMRLISLSRWLKDT